MQDRFFSLEQYRRRIQEVEKYRFTNLRTILPMDAMEDSQPSGSVHTAVPDFVGGKVLNEGDLFSGRDNYLWIRGTVQIPEQKEEMIPVGFFDFGKTGDGTNSGFESLLYIDRHPYQGVDSNHKEVLFPDCAGKTVELTFLLWTGLEGGGAHQTQIHRIRRAAVGYLHQATDSFWFLARAVCGAVENMAPEDPDRYFLMEAMDRALAALDWDADRFYATVGRAKECLESALQAHGKHSEITVGCVGHTHIDVAWLWRLNHTREKAMRSFSTVLHLMESYDDYIFLQSQPQLYRYLKRDCPELFEKVRWKVAEGKWETDGAMWLEADCNISSGEALTRQFLYGIRFFEKEFGRRCTCLWLPDVFGYSWALPQIMNQCGIRTFITSKISWNQMNTMPDDLFKWRGIDGSETLTYFITTPGEGQDKNARYATYNGTLTPETVQWTWKRFRNPDLSNEVLISYGFGDGGGGVNREMLEMRRAMDRVPGLPNVKTTRIDTFFDRVHDRIDHTDRYVHTWDGELYLEYHRGTYTSQARNKRWNRKMELKAVNAEWLSVLACLQGGAYNRKNLQEAWEIILRNQFHDIIPGSSIHEVYEDSAREYEQADALLNQVQEDALACLAVPAAGAFTVLNGGSFRQKSCAVFPVQQSGTFYAENEPLEAQKVPGGYAVWTDLAPLSASTVCFRPGEETHPEIPFQVNLTEKRIETPFYRTEWDDRGHIVTLYDKETGRAVLDGPGNVLEIFEDKPLNFDNWDIDVFYMRKHEEAVLTEPVQVLACGPLKAILRFQFAWRHSKFQQDVVFYSKSRRIDFETEADWHEDHRLLKAAFPVAVRSTKATYDIQYGHVERPTHFNTSWDLARFEVVGHQWADLSETDYGVSLLNDCKYGYSIHKNVMKLSLLKSGKYPDTEADMGHHRFTYALLPHRGSVTEGDTISEATALNEPVRVVAGKCGRVPQVLTTNSLSIKTDAVKQAEDGTAVVVRMHECRGATVNAHLHTDLPVRKIVACNLLEEPTEETYEPDAWDVQFHPFELKTFLLLQ